MNKIIKVTIIFFIIAVVILLVALWYFLVDKTPVAKNIVWGVDFSQSQAEYLGLDWKKTYSDIITDLGVKNIKLHTNWNSVELNKDTFNFSNLDWMLAKAEQNNVKIIYVLGVKTGRWPECHIPKWAEGLSENQQKSEILKYITQVVSRYKNSKSIVYWQVENEPLFKFGECPVWYYKNSNFLKEEIALVKFLDASRQIIISDSGELSSWMDASKIGDIVGVTMYRSSWNQQMSKLGINPYSFLSPEVYSKKSEIIKKISGKDVICIELQAEPWGPKPLLELAIDEQLKLMNQEILKDNIDFAKKTGLDKFYLWGVEWWYYTKEKQNHPEIWQEAKQLFNKPQ